MKKVLLALAVVMFAFSVNAQVKIGVSGGIALPMGDFGTAYKMSFGGGVTAKKMLGDKMAIGLGLSYIMLSPTDEMKAAYGGADVTTSYMPINASFTYYFATEGFKPYAGIDLGYYMFRSSYGGLTVSTSDIGFAPTVGFEYGFSDKMALDVNAKYHYIMTEGSASSMVGVNVGLVFALGGK